MSAPVTLPQISYTAPGLTRRLWRHCMSMVLRRSQTTRSMMTVLPESMVSGWPSFQRRSVGFQDGSREAGRLLLARGGGTRQGFCRARLQRIFSVLSWGRCPESLQADLASHFAAAVDLGAELLNCIARSLPEAVTAELTEPLRDMIQGSEQSMLRVLHYPPVPTGRSVLRAAPHEDINCSPCCRPRTALGSSCNCAVASGFPCPFSRPTDRQHRRYVAGSDGGYLPSTSHRVATPDTEQPAVSRMSLPLFCTRDPTSCCRHATPPGST